MAVRRRSEIHEQRLIFDSRPLFSSSGCYCCAANRSMVPSPRPSPPSRGEGELRSHAVGNNFRPSQEVLALVPSSRT